MANWKEALQPDPYIKLALKTLHRRITLGETPLVIASTQIERAVAYDLPVPKWISKKFPVKPRQRWDMDYSVGGPLWQEWQRLQTHSEWEKWKCMYSEKQPLNKFRIFYDWLLENDFPVEADCVLKECIEHHEHSPIARYYTPPFQDHKGNLLPVNEGSDPEPVETPA